jgi:restriction endonuclease S subunit
MHKFQLSDLCADIFTGIPGSYLQACTDNAEADFHAVNGSALTADGEVSAADLQPVQVLAERDLARFKLLEGDVLLLSRGSSMKAALVTAQIAALNTVPSANLVVIRPDSTKLKGELLVAYFNSDIGQLWLEQNSVGASIRNLPAGVIKSLELKVPQMNTQHDIAALFHANLNTQKAGAAMLMQQKRVADAAIQQLMQAGV